MIRVPEQYTPSSTVFFDELRANQIEQKATEQSRAATASSAFSFYTKQEHPQPSSSPVMTTITSDLIENISPIHPYTPRSSRRFVHRTRRTRHDGHVRRIRPGEESHSPRHPQPTRRENHQSQGNENGNATVELLVELVGQTRKSGHYGHHSAPIGVSAVGHGIRSSHGHHFGNGLRKPRITSRGNQISDQHAQSRCQRNQSARCRRTNTIRRTRRTPTIHFWNSNASKWNY